MENDLHNDNFKGALFQNFENEAIKAPEIAWNNIEKELFNERGQSVGFDATTRPTAITGLTEPLPHGLDKPQG